MQNFRVARCLDEDGVHEYAIFEDGTKKRIFDDNEYGKYFYVENELNPDVSRLQRRRFTGRIKDAVDTIRNGNGDVIVQSKGIFGGTFDKVLYFIDRKVGEEVRAKFIEGWKDSKFVWAVTCGNKNSFSGYRPLNKNGTILSIFENSSEMQTFETEEEAKDYITGLIERAKVMTQDAVKKITENQATIEDAVDQLYDDIEKETGERFHILGDIVSDMVDGNMVPKSEDYSLDEWGYKIIQHVVA